MIGCASVSLIIPIPALPLNLSSSPSNLDRKYVLSRYKEGLDAYQILTELEVSGYDVLNYSTIEEIINSYERYHRN